MFLRGKGNGDTNKVPIRVLGSSRYNSDILEKYTYDPFSPVEETSPVLYIPDSFGSG